MSVLDDTQPIGLIDIDSFVVTVLDSPPEIRFNEVELTRRITEGQTVSLQGSFDDESLNDLHTVFVNWGDGSPEESQILPVGARSFNLHHQYLDDGVSLAGSHIYRVIVRVQDESGAISATPVFLVEVDNLLPTGLTGSLDQTSIDEGGTVALSGSFSDPGLLDTHVIYINWGDGSPREKLPSSAITKTARCGASHTHTPIETTRLLVRSSRSVLKSRMMTNRWTRFSHPAFSSQ